MNSSIKIKIGKGVTTDEGKRIILNPIYDDIISMNGFLITLNSGKKGLVTCLGDRIIEDEKYDDIEVDCNDNIIVMLDGKKGLVNGVGTEIIATKYKEIKRVMTNKNLLMLKNFDGLYGICDKKGSIVLPVEFKKIKMVGNYAVIKDASDKVGVYDILNEKLILKNEYNNCKVEKDLIVVEIAENMAGVFDLEGKQIVPCQYKKCLVYTDCIIVKAKDNLNGLLKRDGTVVLPAEYTGLYHLDNDPYIIMNRNCKYGVIALNGKKIIDCKYANVEPTDTKDAFILTNITGFKGIANLAGKMILDTCYQKINKYEKFFVVKEDNKFGIVLNDGKVAEPAVYDDIHVNEKFKLIIAAKDEVKGAFNYLIQNVIPMKYNKIETVESFIKVAVKKNGEFLYGLYDSKCNPLEMLKHKNIEIKDGKISFGDKKEMHRNKGFKNKMVIGE